MYSRKCDKIETEILGRNSGFQTKSSSYSTCSYVLLQKLFKIFTKFWWFLGFSNTYTGTMYRYLYVVSGYKVPPGTRNRSSTSTSTGSVRDILVRSTLLCTCTVTTSYSVVPVLVPVTHKQYKHDSKYYTIWRPTLPAKICFRLLVLLLLDSLAPNKFFQKF